MAALAFDSHSMVKNLIAAGMPEMQAEVVTHSIQNAQELHADQLATKIDISRIEGELKLHKWMIGAVFALNVAIFLKLFILIHIQ